jgi:hypothetical protein
MAATEQQVKSHIDQRTLSMPNSGTSSVAYEAPETIIEPYEPNATALLDPENLKWKHLVKAEMRCGCLGCLVLFV